MPVGFIPVGFMYIIFGIFLPDNFLFLNVSRRISVSIPYSSWGIGITSDKPCNRKNIFPDSILPTTVWVKIFYTRESREWVHFEIVSITFYHLFVNTWHWIETWTNTFKITLKILDLLKNIFIEDQTVEFWIILSLQEKIFFLRGIRIDKFFQSTAQK